MSTKMLRPSTDSPRRARGRPRGFDPDVVLDKARLAFLEKGFSATSLDDLAAATGLNRPSLYAAFGDKEQLYLASLRRNGARNIAGLETLLARELPIGERLAQVFTAAIAVYCAPPGHAGCMIVGTATAESPARPEIAAEAAEMLSAIETAFERAFARAVKQGEIAKTPSPAVRARLAAALMHSLSIRARIGSSPSELKPYALATIPALCA